MDIQELIDRLDFDDARIIDAMVEQASLMQRAAEYRVEKMRIRTRLAAEYDREQALCAMELRRKSSERLTEKVVNEQIVNDKQVRQVREELEEAIAVEEHAKLLLDVYRTRASMCKAIVELIGAQNYSDAAFVREETERMGVRKLSHRVKRNFEEGD